MSGTFVASARRSEPATSYRTEHLRDPPIGRPDRRLPDGGGTHGARATRRPRRASRVRDRELPDGERRRPAEGARRLRHVRPPERRARQRRAAAVALHGEPPRLRVADRAADRALDTAKLFSRRDGAVRQRALVVAEQHAGAVSRPALSGDDDPRQRRGGSPAAHEGSEDHAPARDHRLLDGRAAGVPVGRELSGLRRPHRRDLGHGEDVRPRHRAARGTDRRAHRGPGVQRRRLHGAADERHRGVRDGVGRRGSTRRNGGGGNCGRQTRRRGPRSSSTWRRSARTSSPPRTRTT